MQRYDDEIGGMRENADGEWVRFEDVEKEILEARQESEAAADVAPWARASNMESRDIDALADEGVEFPIRKFYGLEFRGLLGDIVRELTVVPAEGPGKYRFRAVIVATCVKTGVSNREVIFEGPASVDGQSDLTPEQRVAVGAIRSLMGHEVDEDIRLDGVCIYKNDHHVDERFDI